MNYIIIDLEDIPKGWIFYYLSEDGQKLKCKKTGKFGFKYKEGSFTYKRWSPLPKSWHCTISERSYKKLMK